MVGCRWRLAGHVELAPCGPLTFFRTCPTPADLHPIDRKWPQTALRVGSSSSRAEPSRAASSRAGPGRAWLSLAEAWQAEPEPGQAMASLPLCSRRTRCSGLRPLPCSRRTRQSGLRPPLQRQVEGFSRWGWWATLFFRLFLCFVPFAQIGQTR